MRNYWTFAGAGELVFGTGAIAHLGRCVRRRGWKRLLVVTDPNLVAAGLVERVLAAVANIGVETRVFTGGRPEPSIAVAEQSRAVAREFAPDAILGLGGGSNLDLAKFTALLHTHGGDPRNYFGFDRVPGPVTPIVGIPTTSGTGSEVSHATVLTDDQQGLKVSTLSPYLRPALALVDPELSFSCPAQASADAGIDALTHAIEAYTATDYRDLAIPPDEFAPYSGRMPIGDCLAERAIELVGRHLVTAVRQPDSRPAREGMSLAATLAGLAFSNAAVAVVHALEYPLGAAIHCSHGAGNGLLLPHVMRFNLPVRTRELARIAVLLGESGEGGSEIAVAEAGIARIEQINAAIGIPARLRDLGLSRDLLPGLAERAFGIRRLMLLNARQATLEDLRRIYEAAF